MSKVIYYFILACVFVVPHDITGQEGTLNEMQQKKVRKINKQAEIEAIQYFKPISPLKIKRVEQLKNKQSDKYEKYIANLIKAKTQLEKLKVNNPAEYEEKVADLKRENSIDELAKQYRSTTDSRERKNIITQLNPLLEKQFEIREERRVKQIKKMEEDLEKLKQTLEMRKKNKEKIIKNYMDKITNESVNLEW